MNVSPLAHPPRFKELYTLEERREVSSEIIEQFPGDCPVVVELDPTAERIVEIARNKFVVSANAILSNFMSEVRKVIRIGRQEPLSVMIEGGHMVTLNHRIGDIYARFKNEDGILYIFYSSDL